MKNSWRVGLFVAAATLGVGSVLSGSALLAATFHGASGVDTNWSTGANWAEGAPPTSGSPNLQVILGSNGSGNVLSSNQDLAAPFELQQLSIGPFGTYTPHAVNGSPLAFSNLGAAPSITSLDFLSPPLTLNNDLIFNADVDVAPPGTIPTIIQYSLNGAISGAGGLRLMRGGYLYLGGTAANTYAGLTTAADGVLYLNKPASVIAVPGDLAIYTGGSTRSVRGSAVVMNDNQIAADASVTINRGLLSIEGGNQTLANLTFMGTDDPVMLWNGGDVAISPTRTLTVTGLINRASINVPPFFPQSTSVISGGTLDLAGAMREFRVDNVNPFGLRTSLTVSSAIANGGIVKTGAGLLALAGAKNTFTGNVLVNDGTFSVIHDAELRFRLEDGGVSNRILGTANVELHGAFTIDAASVTDASGSWNLVEVANLNETFIPGLRIQFVDGTRFIDNGNGVYTSGRWRFTTADGNLTLAIPEPAGGLLALLAVAAGGGCRRTSRSVPSRRERRG
ncbi:MAG: hypothetical protein DCC67_15605 [Planctomycetota bacterium]|nr:MAG: hypothetical protein DCC67_15605 [Planctomycetota bacterium]